MDSRYGRNIHNENKGNTWIILRTISTIKLSCIFRYLVYIIRNPQIHNNFFFKFLDVLFFHKPQTRYKIVFFTICTLIPILFNFSGSSFRYRTTISPITTPGMLGGFEDESKLSMPVLKNNALSSLLNDCYLNTTDFFYKFCNIGQVNGTPLNMPSTMDGHGDGLNPPTTRRKSDGVLA